MKDVRGCAATPYDFMQRKRALSKLLLILAVMALFAVSANVANAQSPTTPTISTVAITSNPGSDNTYATGDIITVSLTFSEAVTVDTTDGTPRVWLNIGVYSRYASYSGDGSSSVVQPFSYTVGALLRDSDGVSLTANSLRLDGGTIQATDDSANATLTHSAMSFPSHKVAAGGELYVGLAQVGVTVGTDLYNAGRSTSNEAWQWQRSATETGPYSDITATEGGTSASYTPSAGDLGHWLKATVTYDDSTGTGWTAESTAQKVLSRPTLSNAGPTHHLFTGYIYGQPVTHRYAQAFTTGSHARGYLLKELRLSLFRSGGPAAGTWAVHANDAGKPAAEPLSAALPILDADLDEEIHTFEEFTHPDGVHLDPDTKYWIVISQTTPYVDGNIGIGALAEWDDSLAEGLATPPVDAGSEDGWSVDFQALAYYHNDPDINYDDTPPTALLPWVSFGYELELFGRVVLRMSLVAPPVVTVQFGESDYTVDEGNSVGVNVELSSDPKRTITIPITAMGEDGATSADYSVSPLSVTFNRGETTKTVTFTTTQDSIDDDDETVKLEFGSMPHSGVSAGTRDETTVSITDDDDPEVEVEFGADTYAVAEGGAQSVTVTLSADPERTVTIPVTKTNQGGATSADYSGVPAGVTFNTGETSKTFTFNATDDSVDDDGESVKLGLGALPSRVTKGTTEESVVSITDDDKPTSLTVKFEQSTYRVGEGSSVVVKLTLSDDPEQNIVIPITSANQGGATSADYEPIPTAVTFRAGETSTSFGVTAVDDNVDDDTESVRLSFGTLPTTPATVTQVSPSETVVSITDDDDPEVEVEFGDTTYAAPEGGTATVEVTLSADPERTVTIPVTKTNQGGATPADYSGVPASVTFNTGEISKTFTFNATDDSVDDDGESVKLGLGALPSRVTKGTTEESVVSITDDDKPTSLTVKFEQSTYRVGEGSSVVVKLTLSDDPEQNIVIPITTTNQGGATSADYEPIPTAVTFSAGETSTSISVTAVDDTVDDDTESVKLSFGTLPTTPATVTQVSPSETVVSITDDDVPEVTVNFQSAALTVAEGNSATVRVILSADPERTVTIPISRSNENGASDQDYSGVPASVTITSGNTSATFSVSITQDTIDDDGESIELGFGAMPTRVSQGATNELAINITDDDDPQVSVSFEQAQYSVDEGQDIAIKVVLSADPERSVAIPISRANLTGASNADYSVPANVTFASGDTEKTITFTTTQDTIDDDGEKVRLGFGSLPARVAAGTTSQTTVSITDDDDPQVSVSFGANTYAVAEGGTRTISLTLNADPERTVAIPVIVAANQGGATSADYSGVPASVTFNAGQTSRTLTFTATQDTLDDDDESVRLEFGTLPARVSEGARDETTVNIRDDDDPEVTVSASERPPIPPPKEARPRSR